jgi:hypothetical protein
MGRGANTVRTRESFLGNLVCFAINYNNFAKIQAAGSMPPVPPVQNSLAVTDSQSRLLIIGFRSCSSEPECTRLPVGVTSLLWSRCIGSFSEHYFLFSDCGHWTAAIMTRMIAAPGPTGRRGPNSGCDEPPPGRPRRHQLSKLKLTGAHWQACQSVPVLVRKLGSGPEARRPRVTVGPGRRGGGPGVRP